MTASVHGIVRLITVSALLFLCQTTASWAGSIPFQDTWTYDGPQPHGPGADPLIDHQPYNFGGLASDTMASEIPGGTIVAQFVADDFLVTAPSSVRRIVFWGFHNLSVEPTSDEAFEIKFHAARPTDNLPGDVLFQTTVVNPTREWTGRQIIVSGAPREYKYSLDLAQPLSLNSNERIWLSIYQIGDPASTFRWEHSVNGDPNGDAFNNEFVQDWTFVPWPQGGNNAFQLFSTPEPSSCAFLLLATIGLGCRRCERRR